MRVALFVHVISVVVWVGGMFVAHQAVRPAAVAALDPPQRLKLWAGIFRRFFAWVWASVVLILASGVWMMIEMGTVPIYAQAMAAIGIIMMAIFLHIFFAPYRRLKRAVTAADWTAGAAALGQIRMLVGLNLALGLLTIAVAMLQVP